MQKCEVGTFKPSAIRYMPGNGNKYSHPVWVIITLAGMCEQVARDKQPLLMQRPSLATASHDASLSGVVPTQSHFNGKQSIFFQPGSSMAHALFAREELSTKRNALRRWLKKQEGEIWLLVNDKQRLQEIIENCQQTGNSDCAMLLEGARLHTEINALDKAQEGTGTALAAKNQQSGRKESKYTTGSSAVIEGQSEQLGDGFLWGKLEDMTWVDPLIMELWSIVLNNHPVSTSNQSQTQVSCNRKQGR